VERGQLGSYWLELALLMWVAFVAFFAFLTLLAYVLRCVRVGWKPRLRLWRRRKVPEFEARFDDGDGEESLLNVEVVGGEQQKTGDRVRSELNVNVELSVSRRRPWKRDETTRRKLGISDHRVYGSDHTHSLRFAVDLRYDTMRYDRWSARKNWPASCQFNLAHKLEKKLEVF